LEGPPGTGKSATAHAVAEEMGCTTLSKHVIPANKLNVELAEALFGRYTRFIPMDGAPFHVVVVEEFERVVSPEVKGYLKTALDWSVHPDDGLPLRCIVVATSNNVEKIEEALLERFNVLQFSGGPSLAGAAQERLAEIWAEECPGEDMPPGWQRWGWIGDRFSMRSALREMEQHLLMECAA
jgi:MoxR-like ATPase